MPAARRSRLTATVKIKVRTAGRHRSRQRVLLLNFVYDEVELTDYSKSRVELLVERIRNEDDDVDVEIYTHTDNIGSDAYNRVLSEQRANALRRLLIDKGIEPERIQAFGKGENNPMADNSTEAGQAINRRAEFVFKRRTTTQ